MYKNILVAVDGSETSNLAIIEGSKLAKAFGSSLEIVTVVDVYAVIPEVEYIAVQDIIDSMKQRAVEILEQASALAKSHGVIAQTKTIETDLYGQRVAEAIEQEANTWPADLIVLGTHGRKGFSHFLLGSVAEAIVRVSTKPVLLIRSAPEEQKK